MAIDGPTTTGTHRYYTPFGEDRDSSGAPPASWPGDLRGFLNAPTDPTTGLTSVGQRQYDAGNGAFLSPDPVVDPGSVTGTYGYVYGLNNPIMYSDATGQRPTIGDSEDPHPSTHNHVAPSSSTTTPSSNSTAGSSGCSTCVTVSVPTGRAGVEMPNNPLYNRTETYDMSPGPGLFSLIKAIVMATPHDLGNCADHQLSGCGMGFVDLVSVGMLAVPGADLVDAQVDGSIQAGRFAKTASDVDDAAKAADADANAGRTAAESCLRSFGGATPVLMADGSQKAIRNIKAGDEVMASDPQTGNQKGEKVSHVWVHHDTLSTLALEDGTRITTTEDHPFWSVTDQRFEHTDHLAKGELVLTADGRPVPVLGLRSATAHRGLAYNLTVDSIHTYHVGTDAILVHNACWSIRGRLRAAGPGVDQGLPSSGKIRFVPERGYNPASPLPRGPQGGFIDRFDNEWVRGPSRTPGDPFEWDVQLSRRGRAQLGQFSRDGAHINVTPDGWITH